MIEEAKGSSSPMPGGVRVGHLRVYHEASKLAGPCVTVRAVGIEVRERVLIGGVEIDLS